MNFAALDLNLLRVFDALMRDRSATRAGERIGLSQPAVSSALNRLRHITGDQLFVREGNTMVPTPQALALVEPVQAALQQIEQALAHVIRFDPSTSTQTFRLLGSDYFSTMLMPELASRVADEAPGVLLQLFDGGPSDVIRRLGESTIDIALAPPVETPEWLSQQALFESYLVAAAVSGHPTLAQHGLKAGDTIPIDLLCSLPHALSSMDGALRTSLDLALARVGKKRRVAVTLPHFHATALAIATGRFIGALPVSFAAAAAKRLGLDLYHLPVEVAPMTPRMYWHKRNDADPGQVWLRNKVVDVFSKGKDPFTCAEVGRNV